MRHKIYSAEKDLSTGETRFFSPFLLSSCQGQEQNVCVCTSVSSTVVAQTQLPVYCCIYQIYATAVHKPCKN